MWINLFFALFVSIAILAMLGWKSVVGAYIGSFAGWMVVNGRRRGYEHYRALSTRKQMRYWLVLVLVTTSIFFGAAVLVLARR